MAKADKSGKTTTPKKPKAPPPSPPSTPTGGPDTFDITFNLKFNRNQAFLGHTGKEHVLQAICWLCDYDAPDKFVIAPVETRQKSAADIEQSIAEHRRNRSLLSVALALVDAEFDHTTSTLRKKS